MHFAAFLDVGESVREPVRYYRNNVMGALSVLEAMAAERVQPLRVVVDVRHLRRADRDADCRDRTRRIRSTATARPSWRSNARCRTSSARTTSIRSALRYFNASGADPDGEIGEDHSPEIHLIPRAIDAAIGGPGLQVFGDDYPTPDGTCLRDYIHVSDLADAHVKALEAVIDTRRSTVYNLGTGHPHSVRDVIETVGRVTGRPVPWTLAPRRPGDPAVLYASAQKARTELHWTPRHASLDSIVQTAWDWHRRHPHGYEDR